MKRRKMIALLMAVVLAAMPACGTTQTDSGETSSSDTTATGDEAGENEANEKEAGGSSMKQNSRADIEDFEADFDKTATIEETVLYDANDVKITAESLEFTDYCAELKIEVENNRDSSINVEEGTTIYTRNSINGYMVDDGNLFRTVDASSTEEDTLSFSYDELILCGITEIADIEVDFAIENDQSEPLDDTGLIDIPTSLHDSHDYEQDTYPDAINNQELASALGYTVEVFSEDTVYDDGGIQVLSTCLMQQKDGKYGLILEAVNNADSPQRMQTSDLYVNGLVIQGDVWNSEVINPGKKALYFVNLEPYSQEVLKLYGIKEIGSMQVSVNVTDEKGVDLCAPSEITVDGTGKLDSFDDSGDLLYDDNGIRIIQKGLLDEEMDGEPYIWDFMLIQNTSGKDVYIDLEDSEMQINDQTVDVFSEGQYIRDGETAVFEIDTDEYALEGTDITSASDVDEIVTTLYIENEDWEEMDTPELTIEF